MKNMRWWKGLIGFYCVLLWMGGAQVAWGDLLSLSEGRKLEGVIVQEAKSQIRVQVSWQGYVTVDRSSVVSVTRGGKEDNARLLGQWRRDFLVDQNRERKKSSFEAAQRAKGLVMYKGSWISQAELASIQSKQKEEQTRKEKEAREEAARRAAEEEAKRTERRIQALEEENLRLRQQTVTRQELLIVPNTVIVHPHHDHNLFRDERGNLIRVEEHEGHQFFTTTDGKHVDVQSHDGHLVFTDERGIRHDLEQAAH